MIVAQPEHTDHRVPWASRANGTLPWPGTLPVAAAVAVFLLCVPSPSPAQSHQPARVLALSLSDTSQIVGGANALGFGIRHFGLARASDWWSCVVTAAVSPSLGR
jgi:hypothetical protein